MILDNFHTLCPQRGLYAPLVLVPCLSESFLSGLYVTKTNMCPTINAEQDHSFGG